MSALNKALNDVRHRIPPRILHAVFAPVDRRSSTYHMYGQQQAIENMITSMVINGRVRTDIDLQGASEVEIPLTGIKPQMVGNLAVVYKFPSDALNGRNIISPLAIIYGLNGDHGYWNGSAMGTASLNQQPNNAILSAVGGLVDAHSPIADVQNSEVRLVAPNTVACENFYPTMSYGWLRCLVSHDDAFTAIPPAYWTAFSKLVVYAVKAFIYNEYIIELNEGELSGGKELGSFRSIVEEYADCDELYLEYLETTWRQMVILADPVRKSRMIRMIVGKQ